MQIIRAGATLRLSVRETPGGTVLVKCFAGCGAAEIVSALGIGLRDLFPAGHAAPNSPRSATRAQHWHAMKQAMQTVYAEALIGHPSR